MIISADFVVNEIVRSSNKMWTCTWNFLYSCLSRVPDIIHSMW